LTRFTAACAPVQDRRRIRMGDVHRRECQLAMPPAAQVYPRAGRQIVDDFLLYGGEPAPRPRRDWARAGQATGQCTQADEVSCLAAAGSYQGDKLACAWFRATRRAPVPPMPRPTATAISTWMISPYSRVFQSGKRAPGCGCFDRGRVPDGRIDQADFEAFRECVTGRTFPSWPRSIRTAASPRPAGDALVPRRLRVRQ